MQRTIALITQQLSIVLGQYMIRLADESSRMAKRNMNRHECVLLRHGVLLVFGAPCQLQSLAGQEHGRTIPLAEVGPGEWRVWSCPIPAIHPVPDIRRSSGGSDASRVDSPVRGDVVDLAARDTDVH